MLGILVTLEGFEFLVKLTTVNSVVLSMDSVMEIFLVENLGIRNLNLDQINKIVSNNF